MNIDERIKAFARLGIFIKELSSDDLQTLSEKARNENPWFTKESISLASASIAEMLNEESLKNWLKNLQR